jgi:excisionase family DNA binding protein
MEKIKLVRPREVAQQLAVSKATVYRWFWEGKLKGVKLTNRSLRILQSSVDKMTMDFW